MITPPKGPSNLQTPTRNAALDVLRTFAVLLVLGHHMTPACPPSYPDGVRHFFEAWMRGGWAGVDLFFVLSGFLVSGLLFGEHQKYGTVSYGRFFVRRAFKIYPSFYAFVIIAGIAEFILTRKVSIRGLCGEILFLQNYVGEIWNHTWSLAVEEHFYLGIGLLLTYLSRRDRMSAVPKIFLAIAAFCLVARIITHALGGTCLSPTHLRIDALMMGVLLSYFAHFHAEALSLWVNRNWILLLITALILIAPVWFLEMEEGPYLLTFGLTANYVGFCALVALAVFRFSSFFDHAFFRVWTYIGAHSYTIYLWHMLSKRFFSILRKRGTLELPFVWELLSYIAVSFVVGILMSWLVERPFLNLRDRLFPSRSGSLERTESSSELENDEFAPAPTPPLPAGEFAPPVA